MVRGGRVGIQGSSVRGGEAVVLALGRDQVRWASSQIQSWAADAWTKVSAVGGPWEVARGQTALPAGKPLQDWRVVGEGEWGGAMVDDDAGFVGERGKGVGSGVRE